MFVGHQRQRQFLKRGIEQGSTAHGLLFSGQEGLGKKIMALKFIRLINCQAKEAAPLNELHPDFVLIEPKAQKEIPIAEIRDLIWKLSLKPVLVPFKTAVIDNAHRMNAQSQNCLLKTLEEPKGKALLILVTSHPERLLPTVRSRLQELKFYPLGTEEMTRFLKANDCPENKIKSIIRLSLGRPAEALAYLQKPKTLAAEAKQIKDLILFLQPGFNKPFKYIHSLSKKDSLRETLGVWLKYLREVLLLKVGGKKEIGLPSELTELPLAKLKKIIQGLERINFLIATKNVNKRLVLESLILEL